MRLTCLLLSLGLLGVARAEPAPKRTIYQGTLGKQVIAVELFDAPPEDATGVDFSGRYFYARHGIDLGLSGTGAPGAALVLHESTSEDGKPGATWSLAPTAKGYAGEWQGEKRKLPITLTRVASGLAPVDPDAEPTDLVKDPFEKLRLDAPLAVGPEVAVGAKLAYAMSTDPRIPLSLPRLTKFPDAKVMRSVNKQLDRVQLIRRETAFQCSAQGLANGHDSSYQDVTKVALLTEKLLSIDTRESYDCGGPYPTDGEPAPLVFDLTTGKPIDWKRFFKPVFADHQVMRSTELGQAYEEGVAPRASAKHPTLASLYDALHTKQLAADPATQPEDEKECGGDLAQSGYRLYLHFSAQGLVVQPSVPHAIAPCADAVTIPYAQLAPFLRDTKLVP